MSERPATAPIPTISRDELGWRRWWLVAAVAGLLLLVDGSVPLGVADGVLYVVLVLMTVDARRPAPVLAAAALATLLVPLGWALSPPGGEAWKVSTNRGLSWGVIWTGTAFVLHRQVQETRLRALVDDLAARHRELGDSLARERAQRERIRNLAAELAASNRELEAFAYSVSHDLRAPLRAIDGFGQALLEDHGDALDDDGRECLHRVRAASQRMGRLIEDLLQLSRITRQDMRRERVSLTDLARRQADELRSIHPRRAIRFEIPDGLEAEGDPALLEVLLANLLGNAVKFTAPRDEAVISLSRERRDGVDVFSVRDNGVGFDPAYAHKLFGAFQRLHDVEFPGTGIGLATVQRVVRRHGGEVWAESAVDDGATFFFTLAAPAAEHP